MPICIAFSKSSELDWLIIILNFDHHCSPGKFKFRPSITVISASKSLFCKPHRLAMYLCCYNFVFKPRADEAPPAIASIFQLGTFKVFIATCGHGPPVQSLALLVISISKNTRPCLALALPSTSCPHFHAHQDPGCLLEHLFSSCGRPSVSDYDLPALRRCPAACTLSGCPSTLAYPSGRPHLGQFATCETSFRRVQLLPS